MKNVFQPFLVAAAIFFAACNNPSTTDNVHVTKDSAGNGETVKAHIRKEASNFEAEMRKGDSTAMAAHYAPDATIMPPNSEPVKGNDIISFWGGAVRMGVKDMKLNITDISGDGDVYAETGNFEMYGADNKSLDKGKYVVVWKKQNGIWKMYRDIWNSNMSSATTK